MSKETPMGELRQWCEARAGECGTKAEDPAIAERLQLGWAMSADAFACVIEKIDDMDPANASPPDHEPGERSTIEEKLSPEQQVLIWRIGERIAIWRIGERIADEVEKVAAGRQSDCEAAAGEIYAMLTATAKAEESSDQAEQLKEFRHRAEVAEAAAAAMAEQRDEAIRDRNGHAEHVLRMAQECEAGLAALTEIDECWEACGLPGNRGKLRISEQVSALSRDLDAAEDRLQRAERRALDETLRAKRYEKLLRKASDLVLGINDRLENDGDRVFLGSTNDADTIHNLGHELQEIPAAPAEARSESSPEPFDWTVKPPEIPSVERVISYLRDFAPGAVDTTDSYMMRWAADHLANLKSRAEHWQRVAESSAPARSASPAQIAWDWLASRNNLELDWGEIEEGEATWRVHRTSGGRSDREWELIGIGDTPLAAVLAALAGSTPKAEGEKPEHHNFPCEECGQPTFRSDYKCNACGTRGTW